MVKHKSWVNIILTKENQLREFNENDIDPIPLGNNPYIDYDGVIRFRY